MTDTPVHGVTASAENTHTHRNPKRSAHHAGRHRAVVLTDRDDVLVLPDQTFSVRPP